MSLMMMYWQASNFFPNTIGPITSHMLGDSISEVILVTSAKDSGGIAALDLATGTAVAPNFKNCIADPGSLCLVGGMSAYSGLSCRGGDFIVCAQAKKPIINVWQWNKPQVHMQIHVQEIITSIASDSTGTFLFGGTKKGCIYVWNVTTGDLLRSWQAHFKEVAKLLISLDGELCFSVSHDGIGKAWSLSHIFANSDSFGIENRQNSLYRQWIPHTLPITDLVLIGSSPMMTRCLTSSLDRSVVLYDVHSGNQVFRLGLPEPIECLACNGSEDIILAGSSSGQIFRIDLIAAYRGMMSLASTQSVAPTGLPEGVSVLIGHSKSITSLSCSLFADIFISSSSDGSIRWWDSENQQCIREAKPFQKTALTNAVLTLRPEYSGLGIHNPTLASFEHLHKFPNKVESIGAASTSSSRIWGNQNIQNLK